MIWLARYAGLFLASLFVFVVVFSLAYRKIMPWFLGRHKDFTVIYTDNEWGGKLAGATKHIWLVKGDADDATAIGGKDAIILYADDLKALNFYSRNRKRFEKAKVHLGLASMDAFLLKAAPEDKQIDLRYFSVIDLAARQYWREHDLYAPLIKDAPEPLHIAIIGYGAVGKAIFKYGFLNNLYRTDQAVHYHIWGCAESEKAFLEELNKKAKGIAPKMGDEIHAHETPWNETVCRQLLELMDRIIVARENPIDAIQELLHINPQCEIHCYSSEDTDFATIFNFGKIRTFGVNDVLNVEDIKAERKYEMAKLINLDYYRRDLLKKLEKLEYFEQKHKNGELLTPEEKNEEEALKKDEVVLKEREGVLSRLANLCHRRAPNEDAIMESEWRKLDGFHQGSNIAAADHYWIKKRLKEKASAEEIRHLEHIRWCRYLFFNHWEYVQPPEPGPDGKRKRLKIAELRRHSDLAPYDRLDKEEQDKDEFCPGIKSLLNDILETENSTFQGDAQ